MTKNYICGGEKYEVGGPKGDVIGLPVFPTGLPEKIKVEGYTLLLRTSFHVSLVCIGKIVEKQDVSIPDFQNKIVADFCEFTQDNKVDLIRFRDEYRFVSENERRAVVVMCEVSNINDFFDLLNKKHNLKLEHPPTHATLYTLQPNIGIFLTDADDVNRLSKVIQAPVKL